METITIIDPSFTGVAFWIWVVVGALTVIAGIAIAIAYREGMFVLLGLLAGLSVCGLGGGFASGGVTEEEGQRVTQELVELGYSNVDLTWGREKTFVGSDVEGKYLEAILVEVPNNKTGSTSYKVLSITG